jgi:hypothetical protein
VHAPHCSHIGGSTHNAQHHGGTDPARIVTPHDEVLLKSWCVHPKQHRHHHHLQQHILPRFQPFHNHLSNNSLLSLLGDHRLLRALPAPPSRDATKQRDTALNSTSTSTRSTTTAAATNPRRVAIQHHD